MVIWPRPTKCFLLIIYMACPILFEAKMYFKLFKKSVAEIASSAKKILLYLLIIYTLTVRYIRSRQFWTTFYSISCRFLSFSSYTIASWINWMACLSFLCYSSVRWSAYPPAGYPAFTYPSLLPEPGLLRLRSSFWSSMKLLLFFSKTVRPGTPNSS